MDFQLNSTLDLERIAEDYSADHRVRVDQLLPEDQAVALSQHLAEQINYRHAFVIDKNYGEVSDEQLNNLTEKDRNQLINAIQAQAAHGVGFWYERFSITSEAQGLSGDLFNWLNSNSLLKELSELTKEAGLTGAIAQATRYQQGDFLTRHQDAVTKEKRKLAYVINLSPSWHPDWGGLLQFYEKNGTPCNAWTPDFNSLSLFDVSHVHSVTCISPFAPKPRLAISGWFLQDESVI